MAEYKHGEMDITQQTAAFDGFMKFAVRASVVIFAILLFLAVFAS